MAVQSHDPRTQEVKAGRSEVLAGMASLKPAWNTKTTYLRERKRMGKRKKQKGTGMRRKGREDDILERFQSGNRRAWLACSQQTAL